MMCLRPGQFEFEEVKLVPSGNLIGVHAEAWLLARCPDHVTELFWAFIDGEPSQLLPRECDVTF